MILAVGCLVDLQNRKADHPDAEKYHQLAGASLRNPCHGRNQHVETITALFYEIWYLLVFSDKKKAAGYAWGLMGLTAKLAQSVSFVSARIDFLILTMASIFRSVSVCVPSRELLQVYSYHLCYALVDRNGGKSKVIPEEVDKRRSLFWELLYLDARLVSPTAPRGYGAHG